MIGAYAYFWYSGKWLHKTVRQADPPTLGEYDNTVHGTAVASSLAMARAAKIDFLSCSWDHRHDNGHVLDAARCSGVAVTYHYESLHLGRDAAGRVPASLHPEVARDMGAIRELFDEPAWLRIDGRPVVMVYVVRAYADPVGALKAIRSALGNDALIVGDYLWWDPLDPAVLAQLDACTYYNMFCPPKFVVGTPEATAKSFLDTSREQLDRHAETCRVAGIPIWGCAMPGYNDTGVRSDRRHPILPRLDGEFYRRSLMDAKALTTGQALMVCSWSEWFEDSQIEPCASYGDKYLNLTREFKDANPLSQLPRNLGIR